VRRAAKRDNNHAEIVAALRAAGCGVVDLAAVGTGVPDLVVCAPTWPHTTSLIEVKDGRKPPSARQLTPDQQKFHAAWRGPIAVVTNVAEALAAVGLKAA
jgi:hypothetical protein